ncbi:MAG: response regulator, partial [Fimbriimonadaceae bacterium]|nr:response regulator [Fimbriimonadaceae bacterium]
CACLQSGGHLVQSVASGAAALELLETAPFDVVLTDRSMPEMSGDRLALRIRERWPELPVLMLTGFGSLMQDEPPPPGVDQVIAKPATLRELCDAVAAAGGRRTA